MSFNPTSIIFATGFLHLPLYPAIEGLENFAGDTHHSAQWPANLDLTGQRVGVIGSGSSGVQITSALVNEGIDTYHFVRTPQWVETINNPSIPEWARKIAGKSNFLGQRVLNFYEKRTEIDPRLTGFDWKLQAGKDREEAQTALREDLEAIADRQLKKALTPDFEPGCKRVPKSPDYYDAIQKSNATLVRENIVKVTPSGILVENDIHHELDTVVLASGFDAHAYMRPVSVKGIEDLKLDDVWRNGPYAYKGITVPGFPNMFLLNGPFAPVNTISPAVTLDNQIQHILEVTSLRPGQYAAPRSEAVSDALVELAQSIDKTVWSTGCNSWYIAESGVPVLWPYDYERYVIELADVKATDFEFYPMESRERFFESPVRR